VGSKRAGHGPLACGVRLFLLCRHGQSQLNVEGRVNGDPARHVALTEEGRARAERLGAQLRQFRLDVCVHTRFGRTRETAAIALAGRDVAFREEPLLDDIDVGDLEGHSVDEYRVWKEAHTRADPFPGGESLDAAARRYARGLRGLLALDASTVLVVCHEIPVRYALNAAAGSPDLDGPVHDIANATPFLFDEAALERAAERVAAG
jgi:broad specificity phosphatase PhoE